MSMMAVDKVGCQAVLVKMFNILFCLLFLTSDVRPTFGYGQRLPPADIDASSALRVDQGMRVEAAKPTFNLSLANITSDIRALPRYAIDCFEPGQHTLYTAVAADCEDIINYIILALGNPMQEQTFGFDEHADVDLSTEENRRWYHGQCVVTLSSLDKSQQDTFRPLDVAIEVQRVIQHCITGSKFALGGTTEMGSIMKDFFVIVGGLPPLPTHLTHTLPPIASPDRSSSSKALNATSLDQRSISQSNSTGVGDLPLLISCVKPGMPAAVGTLNITACTETARLILSDPRVMDQQLFTTELSGGVHVPFVQYAADCFFQVNTHAHYSSSASFSLLKAVYYASEVIRKCPLGGVAKLTHTGEGGFFVSVTGLNPLPAEDGLQILFNNTYPGLDIDIY